MGWIFVYGGRWEGRSDLKVAYENLGEWHQLLSAGHLQQPNSHDLLILISTRRGYASWQPGLKSFRAGSPSGTRSGIF